MQSFENISVFAMSAFQKLKCTVSNKVILLLCQSNIFKSEKKLREKYSKIL